MLIELTEKERKLLNENFIPSIEAFLQEKNMFFLVLFSTFNKFPKSGYYFFQLMLEKILTMELKRKPSS